MARFFAYILALSMAVSGHAGDALRLGEFIVDPPTLICLGFAWEIEGDSNRNATATVMYRVTGTKEWRGALPFLRIGGHHVGRTPDWLDREVPHMLAGSIMDLEPGTSYDVRIEAQDPDGVEGDALKMLRIKTRAIPRATGTGTVYHVYPLDAKASWTRNEFKRLYGAYYGGVGCLGDFNTVWERIVQPGDTIIVHAGVYKATLDYYVDKMGLVPDGTYWLTAKGTPEEPIAIKAAGDGEVVFDGNGCEVLLNVMAADHHVFEGLTFRNCGTAIFAGQQRVAGCDGLVVRKCRFENVRDGIWALYGGSRNFYIADNVFVGRNRREALTGWGTEEDGFLKSNSAITLQGAGHVVCRNSVAYFWQAFHMGTARPEGKHAGTACDFYLNELNMLIDDGIEVDGGVRNIRVLRNRIGNVGAAISAQPIYGGPAYFIRNVAYNCKNVFKFHEAHPSGLLVYHNTVVGDCMLSRGLYTNARFVNNLYMPPQPTPRARFAVPEAGNAVLSDYNGFGTGTLFATSVLDGFAPIMDKSRDPYWPLKKYPAQTTDVQYTTLDAFREATGNEVHGRMVGTNVFAGLRVMPSTERRGALRTPVVAEEMDFTLRAAGDAVDAGHVLPNVNDGFKGDAPDLGAYEYGRPEPEYGPRE